MYTTSTNGQYKKKVCMEPYLRLVGHNFYRKVLRNNESNFLPNKYINIIKLALSMCKNVRFVIIFTFYCQLFYLMFVCHMFGFDVFYWV